jgi:uncharacterized protein (TIGR02145 family)
VSLINKSGICALVFISLLLAQCEKKNNVPELLKIDYTVKDVTANGKSDGSIDLTVSGGVTPYEYYWSNGSFNEDIDGLAAGLYSVTVTDAIDSTAIADSIIVNEPLPDTIVTDIEGNIYPIVKIGKQIWMAENLKVIKDPEGTPIDSYCYDDNTVFENKYGRLYTWDVAMNGSVIEMAQGICPDGWHIPSDEEWKTLEMYLGMTEEEANMENIWRGEGIGTSLIKGGSSGYEARLCGRRSSIGSYMLIDQFEYVWTSTEYGDYAWRRCLNKADSRVGRWNTFPKTYGFSVRCIKNK